MEAWVMVNLGVVAEVTIVFKGPYSMEAMAAKDAIKATIHVWDRTIFLVATFLTVFLFTKMVMRMAARRMMPMTMSWV